MKDDFYLRFEDRFRGTREDVTRKQRQYLPLLEPVRAVFAGGKTLDLGCGRGEWLELMIGMGFSARGVDLNESMVDLCRHRGLDIEKQDAIKALRVAADDSLAIVSGFHIVEHMFFDDVLTLVAEAYRALRPGGLLILETPNPENLMVATWSFRMDPTHHHPIPPDLMQFVGEDAGFSPASIIRLNGPDSPGNSTGEFSEKFRYILSDAHDYGLVAQKPADQGIAPVLDYLEKLDKRRALVQQRLDELLLEFGTEMSRLSEEKDAFQSSSEHLAAERDRLQERVSLLQHDIDSVYASRSWRITRPVRVLNRGQKNVAGILFRRFLRAPLERAARSGKVKRVGRVLLTPFPGIKVRLGRTLKAGQDLPATDRESEAEPPSVDHVMDRSLPGHVSERQEAMYRALLRAIHDREKS